MEHVRIAAEIVERVEQRVAVIRRPSWSRRRIAAARCRKARRALPGRRPRSRPATIAGTVATIFGLMWLFEPICPPPRQTGARDPMHAGMRAQDCVRSQWRDPSGADPAAIRSQRRPHKSCAGSPPRHAARAPILDPSIRRARAHHGVARVRRPHVLPHRDRATGAGRILWRQRHAPTARTRRDLGQLLAAELCPDAAAGRLGRRDSHARERALAARSWRQDRGLCAGRRRADLDVGRRQLHHVHRRTALGPARAAHAAVAIHPEHRGHVRAAHPGAVAGTAAAAASLRWSRSSTRPTWWSCGRMPRPTCGI